MKFEHILTELEQADPEIFDRTSSRRDTFKNFGGMGKRLALAALPMAFGSILKKAYGQTPSDIIGVLNYALTLEYLEYFFYFNGVGTNTLMAQGSAADTAALTLIRDHEGAHVSFLRSAITASGGTPVTFTSNNFDFTAKGTFPTVYSDYATFLAVAQTFEDTGVRAYKGQAGNLKSNRSVLTAALNIHSVEARHASHIRQMRAIRGASTKPWIVGNQSGIASTAVQASYNGEELTTQAGVNITNINGFAISADVASASFDEILTKDQVLAIVSPFIK